MILLAIILAALAGMALKLLNNMQNKKMLDERDVTTQIKNA